MDANSPQTLHTLLSMPINHISKLCPLHEELALACLPGSQEQQTELHASKYEQPPSSACAGTLRHDC